MTYITVRGHLYDVRGHLPTTHGIGTCIGGTGGRVGVTEREGVCSNNVGGRLTVILLSYSWLLEGKLGM